MKLMQTGVSVIIPTIRNDQWLDLAVNSILANSNVDFEVIVVFDGIVPDDLGVWSNSQNVSVVKLSKRSGQAAAMSAGLNIAKFKYFARLDADDLSSTTRLANQLNYLENHQNVSAVGSRVIRISEDGTNLGELPSVSTKTDVRHQLLLRNVIAHSSLMARTSSISIIGMYRNDMEQMEDYEFILRLGLVGEIHIIDSVETFYRLHTSQISRKFKASGNSFNQVIITKKQLARHLKLNRYHALLLISIWKFAEQLRSSGLRKPRYLTRLTHKKYK